MITIRVLSVPCVLAKAKWRSVDVLCVVKITQAVVRLAATTEGDDLLHAMHKSEIVWP